MGSQITHEMPLVAGGEKCGLGERRARLADELNVVERRIAQLDELLSPVIEGQAEPVGA